MKRSTNFTIPLAAALLGACAAMGEGQSPTERGPVQVTTTEPNVVPAGTQFAITVDEEINTQEPTNQTYTSHFTQPIVNQNGETIVPEGSPAELIVVSTEEGGTFGSGSLMLGIRSVTVDGRPYTITTGTQEAEGEGGLGANKRTAIFVGGGALLGTAIGAVIGGTRGAIIGGVLGGAAGAGTQVITQGDEVKVPEGTVLEFRLDDSWRLVPRQGPADRPIS
jgi:hypothetical protein